MSVAEMQRCGELTVVYVAVVFQLVAHWTKRLSFGVIQIQSHLA
jgi:hypothetical protein